MILERNVEVGEFITTGLVGDRGAKGYVVSLADLGHLQVELDIVGSPSTVHCCWHESA